MKCVEGLPDLRDRTNTLTLRVCGPSAIVRSPRFIARFCLQSGEIDWLVERSPAEISEATRSLPRRIEVSGSKLWISEADQIVAEIISTECGGLVVSVRHTATGSQLWEHFIPSPEAEDWAERAPAWPGAQTEEIEAFIAEAPRHLVVCLFRQSRRSKRSWPAGGIEVSTLPPYACQTDAIRFDLFSGKPLWNASFRDVPVRIIERRRFTGVWSNGHHLGAIDFETGANTILHQTSNRTTLSKPYPPRFSRFVV